MDISIETTKTTSYKANVSRDTIIDLINERYDTHIPHKANLSINWGNNIMTINWTEDD